MTDDEIQIVDAIRDLIDANHRARTELDSTNALLRRGIDHLEAGGGVVEALSALPIAARRHATQDSFEQVIKARHQLRIWAITACTRQGISAGKVAEIWGVSRQRVVQCLADAKKQGLST